MRNAKPLDLVPLCEFIRFQPRIWLVSWSATSEATADNRARLTGGPSQQRLATPSHDMTYDILLCEPNLRCISSGNYSAMISTDVQHEDTVTVEAGHHGHPKDTCYR